MLLMRFLEGLDHHGKNEVQQEKLTHNNDSEAIHCTDYRDV